MNVCSINEHQLRRVTTKDATSDNAPDGTGGKGWWDRLKDWVREQEREAVERERQQLVDQLNRDLRAGRAKIGRDGTIFYATFLGGMRPIGRATEYTRPLSVDDLGVKGVIQELRGTFALKDGVATMRVEMIKGNIQNPLEIINNMANIARANGATTLRIEGTIANERLYSVLQQRYGLKSSGSIDSIAIPLR